MTINELLVEVAAYAARGHGQAQVILAVKGVEQPLKWATLEVGNATTPTQVLLVSSLPTGG